MNAAAGTTTAPTTLRPRALRRRGRRRAVGVSGALAVLVVLIAGLGLIHVGVISTAPVLDRVLQAPSRGE